MAGKKRNTEQIAVDQILASYGFIFPRTEEELLSQEMLYSEYTYELTEYCIDPDQLINNSLSSEFRSSKTDSFKMNKNTYFKRAVLAAEITSQLYEEITFGHVKLQKLMFLCENIQGMTLNSQYSKQAAGPYNNKFMHSIDKEFEKQKWFKVKQEKSGKFTRYFFIPSENFKKHQQYFHRYFTTTKERIQWFIDTFRKEKTDTVELIATLYACWLELLRNKEVISDANLLSLFYSWSLEKQKFSNENVLNAILWMKENKVIPTTPRYGG